MKNRKKIALKGTLKDSQFFTIPALETEQAMPNSSFTTQKNIKKQIESQAMVKKKRPKQTNSIVFKEKSSQNGTQIDAIRESQNISTGRSLMFRSNKAIVNTLSKGSNKRRTSLQSKQVPNFQNEINNFFDGKQEGLIEIQPSKQITEINMGKKKEMSCLQKQKVKALVHNFIKKLKRNNTHTSSVQMQNLEEQNQSSIWKWQAFNTPPTFDKIIAFISMITTVLILLSVTLQLVFSELRNSEFIKSIETFSLLVLLLEMIYNLLTTKSHVGKRLKIFQDIFHYYLRNQFFIDLANILVLVLSLSIEQKQIKYLQLIAITKIPQSLQKLEKLQVSFIKNYYNEQYWSLVKVVLFNFCFAHIIAICLTAMAKMNPSRNWHTQKNISHNWSSQYIWGYYWAVNIMLTVGFGDLSATTDEEALCLIFVEIFAVMCLAYNINWIGTLISNIRAQDLEKGRNFKTFKQLSDKYGLPSQLEWRISNYIQESVNIRKKFNLQEEKAFVQSLPSTMKTECLRESNKSVFQYLPFFSNLKKRTQVQLAEKIETTISHPQQFLKCSRNTQKIHILRQGQIAFLAKNGSELNGKVFQKIKINKSNKPFILDLQFISKQKSKYQVQTLQYSVICSLSEEQLLKILRQFKVDYLMFCSLRDKNKSIIDQFQVIPCSICKGDAKHTKFTCPKLHYIPLHQILIYKQIRKTKINRNPRNSNPELRAAKDKSNALHLLSKNPQFPSVKEQSNEEYNSRLQVQQKQRKPTLKKTSKLTNSNVKKLVSDLKILQTNSLALQTSQIIRNQISSLFKANSYEDQMWNLALDVLQNYHNYFPQANPQNIKDLQFVHQIHAETDFESNKSRSQNEILQTIQLYQDSQ